MALWCNAIQHTILCTDDTTSVISILPALRVLLSQPVCASAICLRPCIAQVQVKVKEVRYTGAPLKYLLVVLDDSTTQAQLEGLKPDMEALGRAFTQAQSGVHAVCVTIPGSGEWCSYQTGYTTRVATHDY